MFERIIVTLDGSESSEAALGAAAETASRLGSELVLLHVLEKRPPRAIHGERHLAAKAEAEAYLAGLAESLAERGLRASYHVHEGAEGSGGGAAMRGSPAQRGGAESSAAVARAVAEHQAELGTDLAVMAAHGRRGAASALSSSLPLKVASSGGAAVLLVPREGFAAKGLARDGLAGTAGAGLGPKRIVLPLDGRPEHEASLPYASALAKAFGVGLLLVAALPRSAAEGGGDAASLARLAPALSGACLEYAAGAEEEYLASVKDRLAAEGVAASVLVARGRPAKAIASACERGDLVVLSTHRRLGLDASLDGCVAFEVARRWRGAMLIVPIKESGCSV